MCLQELSRMCLWTVISIKVTETVKVKVEVETPVHCQVTCQLGLRLSVGVTVNTCKISVYRILTLSICAYSCMSTIFLQVQKAKAKICGPFFFLFLSIIPPQQTHVQQYMYCWTNWYNINYHVAIRSQPNFDVVSKLTQRRELRCVCWDINNNNPEIPTRPGPGYVLLKSMSYNSEK